MDFPASNVSSPECILKVLDLTVGEWNTSEAFKPIELFLAWPIGLVSTAIIEVCLDILPETLKRKKNTSPPSNRDEPIEPNFSRRQLSLISIIFTSRVLYRQDVLTVFLIPKGLIKTTTQGATWPHAHCAPIPLWEHHPHVPSRENKLSLAGCSELCWSMRRWNMVKSTIYKYFIEMFQKKYITSMECFPGKCQSLWSQPCV